MLRLVAGRDVERERAEAVAEIMQQLQKLEADELRWVNQLLQQLSQHPGALPRRRAAPGP